MMHDIKKNQPWKRDVLGHDEAGGGAAVIPEDEEFRLGIDDPQKLLILARKGDYQALRKLENYVQQQSNPDRTVRLESGRLLALVRGIDGIARYYGNHEQSTREDRRLIERALRRMEDKAIEGNWIYAVALYQFLGSLNEQSDKRLPWGENDKLSAKWLEIVHKAVGKETFEAIVINEACRMGYAQRQFLNGSFFPTRLKDGIQTIKG